MSLKMKSVSVGVLFLSLCAQQSLMASASVDEIMKKNEAARLIPSLTAKVDLKTVSSEGVDEKSFRYWRKLVPGANRFKTLTRFLTPQTIRNQGILFLEQEGFRSDVFLYLPTFKKVRRVESHSQSSSFMGSAFSYSDIATPSPMDFKNKLLKEEPCPTQKEVKCFVVESLPKSKDIQERTGYTRTIQWISRDNHMTVQWHFFKDSDQVKVMQARDFISAGPNVFFSRNVEVENLQSKRKTTLIFSEVNTKDIIDDSIFTQQNLARER